MQFAAVGGIAVFVGIGWVCSEARHRVEWISVLSALAAQFVLAILMLHVAPIRGLFLWLSKGIGAVKLATLAGTGFVFGYAGGAELPFVLREGGNPFIFALQALPMVMVISALSMLLFYWNILPQLVRGTAWLMRRTLRMGGALGVCAAAKVFLGMTEAPLLIRPYLSKLSRHELFCVMTLGMATTSAAVMVIYASILENTIESPIRHILTASCISVPAAVALSRLLVPPPPDDRQTAGDLAMPFRFNNSMDAVARGAADGMQMYLNIIPMLIVSLALVSLVNSALGNLMVGELPLSLQRLLGWVLSPVALAMGIPWAEASAAGQLIGTKLALNEVMAFLDLSRLPPGVLSAHSRLILAYALCGFANLGSIGILIGGIGTMVPERRHEIISMSSRSMLGGALSTCMSGTVVGLLS
jgi:CNT family concentrative nucleoside transporter